MGLEYLIPRKTTEGDESLGEFVTRRFGREALDRLVQPLLGGIYTSDPWKLSLQATMPKFLDMERKHGSLIRALGKQAKETEGAENAKATGARYGMFASLEGGMSELLEALERRITGRVVLRLGAPVTRMVPLPEHHGVDHDGRWRLTLSDGSEHVTDAVILALRAPHSAHVIRPFDPALAGMLQEIDYASSAIVITGHRLSDIRHPMDAFGLVIPHVEKRQVLAVSMTSRKFPNRAPEGHVQLRTFVGGAMQPEQLQKSDEQLVEMVREELRDIFGVEGTPDLTLVCRYTQAMPQYHVGHVDRVLRIEEQAAQHNGLALAGNAYHGVGIPDCIHDAELAAERVFER
jgi:oxygen-dependent protoporphyrinogen oxidase